MKESTQYKIKSWMKTAKNVNRREAHDFGGGNGTGKETYH